MGKNFTIEVESIDRRIEIQITQVRDNNRPGQRAMTMSVGMSLDEARMLLAKVGLELARLEAEGG